MKQTSRNTYHVTRNIGGFTLIEMLIVIGIMVLLAGLSIANFRAGEKQKRVQLAADTITNAIRNAQNFTLTSRQISDSSCIQAGQPTKSSVSYIISFTAAQTIDLYGIDKCNNNNLIESYPYPSSTRIKANGYNLNTNPVSALQFKFEPPFGKLTASSDGTINSATFSIFTNATIAVESSTDSSISRTVTVDGISGRIGE